VIISIGRPVGFHTGLCAAISMSLARRAML
jgi:hypothetical protein